MFIGLVLSMTGLALISFTALYAITMSRTEAFYKVLAWLIGLAFFLLIVGALLA